MDIASLLARPSRLGAATALGTATGILTLCLVFQFVVPAPSGVGKAYATPDSETLRSLILYATAGGAHILLCAGSIVFFCEQLRRSESKLEFLNILAAAGAAFAAIALVILVACYLNLNV